jgi:hypothetical protein
MVVAGAFMAVEGTVAEVTDNPALLQEVYKLEMELWLRKKRMGYSDRDFSG